MAKDAYYFSHDSNASQDPKILVMCSVYKAEGYGWYWMLVEMMREQEDYRLPIKGKYIINALALKMYADAERLHQFIDDCVKEFDLFKTDDSFIWSESLIKRMQGFDIKREKARLSALKRWHKNEPEQCERNANVPKTDALRVKESKVNKSKVKESILKQKFGEFNNVLLTSGEIDKLNKKFGAEEALRQIEELSQGIKSKGYKYKSHYATILTWARKDNRQKPKARDGPAGQLTGKALEDGWK